MNRRSRIAGSLLVVLFGVLALLDASKMPPPRSGGGLGPGFLPFWIGIVLVVLGMGELARALADRSDSGRGPWPEPQKLRRVLWMVAALVAFVLLSDIIGFFLSSWLFLAATMRLLADYRWWAVGAGGLAAAALTTLIFRLWLTLPLPTGFVGL